MLDDDDVGRVIRLPIAQSGTSPTPETGCGVGRGGKMRASYACHLLVPVFTICSPPSGNLFCSPACVFPPAVCHGAIVGFLLPTNGLEFEPVRNQSRGLIGCGACLPSVCPGRHLGLGIGSESWEDRICKGLFPPSSLGFVLIPSQIVGDRRMDGLVRRV